ncbi:UBIQUITIN LIGASE PROTEIN PHF9 FANCONI ANEMIA GROUP L PROTEIN [Salix koriyanagi]|uniref:UBIQUITIN LIGASE PROTEIN PHF9 FANCONI ANEMIA GROUP L PROTEIN n=2 Tax=Salix koriyanagi TaxID=2511006 RepID=A0A9Q0ZFM5_9ROSI|nr:UBIQUITIN LIGASE PROTEIN PHF9 FANCONI ANEMIA GROUP L PROTEIN [Salix koriyanagi]
MDFIEQKRHKELANLSSFYRLVYSEIEEVGWEHLVRFGGDLEFLSFRITDKKGRVHVMEIQLDKTYPQKPPSVSAEVPYIFNVKWSVKSRLKDLVQQFREHLEKLQEFWSTMEDIDHSLCVTNKKELSRATTCRQIDIGNDCLIMLSINAKDPSSLPECRFMGSGLVVNPVRKLWLRNNKRWMKDKTFPENLAFVLETELPRPSHVLENDQQVECGICYAQYLPMDEELGSRSGAGTDHTCDNTSCGRAFHSVCLVDWLRSITTTRQYVDFLVSLAFIWLK